MLARATGPRLAAEEGLLPCADGAFDLVLSCLALHWVDDLVGALVQIRRALKPDGLFVGALFGAGTLAELRQAFAEAEASRPEARIAPFAEIRDAGGLLARAGFQLPVADRDRLAVSYSDSWALMRDLRGMGEGNALTGRRRHFSRRGVFRAVAEHYRRAHGNADARIPASFEIVVLTGWAPGAGQPKPLAPGSAARRLSDALGGGGD
jgi:SAM-dependent methyltransferase